MKASFFTESILYSLAKALSGALRVVPPGWGVAFGSWAGTGIFHLAGRRRQVALANLKSAFGDGCAPEECRRILKEQFQHLGMTLMEVAMIPRIDRAYVDRWVEIAPGCEERLKAALAKGRGVVFVTGHFGNWELIPLVGALHGYPTLVLAREQGWPKLNGLLTRYRESKGCRVVRKGFPIRALIQGLQEGRIVGILSDQDGGRNGVLAPFFGRLASTAPGAIALGINSGAPILPVFMVRRRGAAHTLLVEEPLAVPAEGSLEERIRLGIAQYLEALERMVRRYPAQWLWLHRRWKSSPQKKILIVSDGRAGHLSQARALAQRIEEAWKIRSRQDRRLRGSHPPLVRVEVVEAGFRHPAARAILALAASVVPRRFSGGERWLRWTLKPDSYRRLAAASADWSVSCGSAAAGVNLLWAWSAGARPIQIQRSRWPSWRRFALNVVPRHDLDSRPAPANVLPIDGALTSLARPDEKRLRQWRDLLGISDGRPIALLIGGPAAGVSLKSSDVEKSVEGAMIAAQRLGAPLLVTSSRRTPPALEQWLQERLSGDPRCRLLVLVNRRRSGPLESTAEAVPCLLGLAELLVVSGDSISMVSECCATDKPVIGFISDGLAGSKHHRFLQRLKDEGRITLAAPEAVGEAIEQSLAQAGRPGTFDPKRGPAPSDSEGDALTEFLVRWL